MGIQLYTSQGAICGTFVCGDGTVCGGSSDVYTLPDTLTLQGDEADFRFREQERAWQHGSMAYGEEWEARDFTVSGLVLEDNGAAARALVREMREAAARLNQRLRLSSSADHYVNLARLRRMDARPVALSGRSLLEVRMVWRSCDPFWQAVQPDSHTEELAGDGTFTVHTGSVATVAMQPVICITAPNPGTVSSVVLTNTSDEGQALGYDDAGLRDGATVVIDAGAGTVTRGGTNVIRFYSGGWLRLLPGSNVLAYEGSACTITLLWVPRWI